MTKKLIYWHFEFGVSGLVFAVVSSFFWFFFIDTHTQRLKTISVSLNIADTHNKRKVTTSISSTSNTIIVDYM